MFKKENYQFKWEDLGDIQLGRPNLGTSTHVAVYRLMQYTMRNVLVDKIGIEQTNQILKSAGQLAGREFAQNMLDLKAEFNEFVANLHRTLLEMNVGILKIERSNLETMQFVLTVSEDLDCSGLPFTDETVCDYDEGFIEGIFQEYTGKSFDVKEVDCWSSGDRTCRFTVNPKAI